MNTCKVCDKSYSYDPTSTDPDSSAIQCPKCRQDDRNTCRYCGELFYPPHRHETVCEKEECRKAARVERMAFIESVWSGTKVAESITSPGVEYRAADFSTLNAYHPDLTDRILPFIKGDVLNLSLAGPVGVGKTWAAWATCYGWLLRNRRADFTATDWASILISIQEISHYGSVGGDAKARLRTYETCDLLFVDEFSTTKASEYLLPYIMRIINERVNNHRPTIITTTADVGTFIINTSEGIHSRFRKGWIDLNGRDLR